MVAKACQLKKFIERCEIKTPLGRMAAKDGFRGAIAYLASDFSSYVTNQVLQVDGGWGAWQLQYRLS
jgi:NAD(P)-dependent dehydrogenase (short-subunit alcohol dehydrogenase family)